MLKIILLMTFCFASAFATGVDGFQKRFEIGKNVNGEAVINDKKLLEDVTIINYVTYLKEIFENTDPIGNPPTCAAQVYDKKNSEMYKMLKKTIELMSKFQFDLIINSPGFNQFLEKFETEFNNFIAKEEIRSLANLDNSKYFYEKNKNKYIVDKFTDFLKDAITIPGGIELALFFGKAYESYVLQKRAYDQNILLAYLLKFKPEELGLTDLQVAQAKSSIFESHISFGFSGRKESKKAQENWLGYGEEKVSGMRTGAQERWIKNQDIFNGEIVRMEIFSYALFNQSPIYVNLSQKSGAFSSKPALTFDQSCPDYTYIKRYGYSMVRIGMDVLGIPFSRTIDKLLIEQYQNHIPSEGLLAGMFEIGDSVYLPALNRQALNPFIKSAPR